MNQYIVTGEKIQIILDYLVDEQDSDELRFAAFGVLNNLPPYNPQAEREKVLDEVIEKWREWHHAGYERPIQRETVVKLFEELRREGKDGE